MASCRNCIHSGFCYMTIMHEGEPCEFVDKTKLVEVVRCKDCKHRVVGWNNGEYQCGNPYYGMASGVELRDEDFCSYGERRTDATY